MSEQVATSGIEPVDGRRALGVRPPGSVTSTASPAAAFEEADAGPDLSGGTAAASVEPVGEGEPASPSAGRVVACVDVGSNSVHLLVASVADHQLTAALIDRSVFLGLGLAADAGCFGHEVREALVDALVAYGELACELGAEPVTFVGTEPMRRAADAAVVVRAVERSGWPLHVVDHEEEALLTLIGATGGRPVGRDIVVVDVGGGSTELALVGPDRPARALGIRAGSSRLTRQLIHHDPPEREEIDAVRRAARELLAEAPTIEVSELIAVGGTASNLARVIAIIDGVLDIEAPLVEPWITRAGLDRAIEALVGAPSVEIAERFILNPTRARVLPAGAAILEGALERYGLDRLRATDVGIREGTILATAHAGQGWRDALPVLAHGWVGSAGDD